MNIKSDATKPLHLADLIENFLTGMYEYTKSANLDKKSSKDFLKDRAKLLADIIEDGEKWRTQEHKS